jgi:predicted proteasome-type protease
VRRYRRLSTSDPDLLEVRSNWERELRRAVGMLPQIDFGPPPSGTDLGPTT